MNSTLWIVQVLLALAFLAHSVMMLVPPCRIVAYGRWRRLPIRPR